MKVNQVSNQNELNDCVRFLFNQKSIALDLEFDKNRYRYGFTLCLLQVAAEDQIFVIDPFNRVDLTEFYRLLERKDQQIIVFEFGEDLRLLHTKGCRPSNIYDISTASKLLDNSQLSLGNLALKYLGIEMVKTAQKSNWVLRPLTKEQIEYAADDVRYLFEIEALLKAEIEAKGFGAWVEEENTSFEESVFEADDEFEYLKHKDKRGFSQHHWHLFADLMHMRESFAQQINRPAFQVVDKEFLIELAKDPAYITNFYSKARPHKTLATEPFKQRLLRCRNDAAYDAKQKELSKEEPAIDRLGEDELRDFRAAKAAEEELKETIFKPIQAVLKDRFGENTASYLLSNKSMMELAKGNTSNYRNYRLTLVKNIAEELGLKLPFS
jgi:ribonuclease D